MSVPSDEREAELRRILLARLTAPSRTINTTTPQGSDSERAEVRRQRYKDELDHNRGAEAEKTEIQQGYYDDFTKFRDKVGFAGHWDSHHNDDNDTNRRFKRFVEEYGGMLKAFIADVIHDPPLDYMHFTPPSGRYPGELSTFSIDLRKYWGEDKLKGMTIAGAVTKDGTILVFHAGPGGR